MVKQTPQSSSPSERSDSSKYKGVRKRKWGKWVSEIRLPNSRERIWLGSYDSAEKAARAFDAALFCLRGRNAKFNFPDSPPDIDGGRHLAPSEIQAAAARFANSAAASSPSAAPRSHSDSELHMDRSPSPSASEGTVHMDSDPSLDVLDGSIWDLVGDNNNAAINYNYNYNYNYSYDNVNYHNDSSSSNNNMMGTVPGSGEYPTEYGIFPGFDDLSSDFYAPTLPPVDHGEENFDGLINQSSFLWNF